MDRDFMIKELNDTAVRTYFGLMLYSVQLLKEQSSLEEKKNGTELGPEHQPRFSREFTFELDDISLPPEVFVEMQEVLDFERMLANVSVLFKISLQMRMRNLQVYFI